MTTADVLDAPPPALSARHAEDVARERYGLDATAEPLVSERDQNFRLTDASGAAWVLKVSNAAEDRGVVEMEVAAVERIRSVDPALPVPVARPALDGSTVVTAVVDGATHLVRLLPLLPGRTAAPAELDPAAIAHVGEVVGRIGLALRGFFHPAAGRTIWWDQQHLPELARRVSLTEAPERRELLGRVLERFNRRVVPALPTLRSQLIHNDVTLDNLLLDDDQRVTGIIDFGDMAHTALVLDVPATLQSLVRDRTDLFEVTDAFLAGYASVLPLEAAEAELLGDLLAGRMAQTILISAWRMPQHPDNEYIRGWAGPAWELLEQMEAIGFDEVSRRMAAIARAPLRRRTADDQLLARRHRVLGTALESLSYRHPLHLVRGDGAWMEAADGRRYLDAYNNVPVVGHAHPRVVAAIARQAATLNTNTRYLHEHVVDLAERLVATMPDGLDTVLFVNSGSEANDLAWRLATTVHRSRCGPRHRLELPRRHGGHRRHHGLRVARRRAARRRRDLPGARHLSGRVRRCGRSGFRWARRGRRGREPPRRPRAAAGGAVRRLRVHAPTASSCPRPPSWPRSWRPRAAAGALFVADEVQSGHGRTGELWGFSRWGVTPDIVTLGKPMGNGHPIAAVITRAEIVDRFGASTTFFSTFGGNPVACAAALAVLDVLEEEGLVAQCGDRRRPAALRAGGAGGPPCGDRRRPRSRADDRRRAGDRSRLARARRRPREAREGRDGRARRADRHDRPARQRPEDPSAAVPHRDEARSRPDRAATPRQRARSRYQRSVTRAIRRSRPPWPPLPRRRGRGSRGPCRRRAAAARGAASSARGRRMRRWDGRARSPRR